MTTFEEIWRAQATPVLTGHFGESAKAAYQDGAGTLRGNYDVLLGPEEAVEKDEDRGARASRYRRTATLLWSADGDFDEPTIATTGKLIVTVDRASVTYSIAGVLARSPSGIVLVLQRGGGQRR